MKADEMQFTEPFSISRRTKEASHEKSCLGYQRSYQSSSQWNLMESIKQNNKKSLPLVGSRLHRWMYFLCSEDVTTRFQLRLNLGLVKSEEIITKCSLFREPWNSGNDGGFVLGTFGHFQGNALHVNISSAITLLDHDNLSLAWDSRFDVKTDFNMT